MPQKDLNMTNGAPIWSPVNYFVNVRMVVRLHTTDTQQPEKGPIFHCLPICISTYYFGPSWSEVTPQLPDELSESEIPDNSSAIRKLLANLARGVATNISLIPKSGIRVIEGFFKISYIQVEYKFKKAKRRFLLVDKSATS